VVYAASCEQGDVQAAIDSASDGDVVLLPECTAEWTTPGGCTANVCASILIDGKEITLLGAGIDRTRIKDRTIDAYGHEPLMRVVGVEGKPFRITGIAFVEVNDKAIAIEGTCKNWRVDHCKVDTLETLSKLTGGYAVTASGHTYGVIDHCSFTNNEVSVYGAAGIEWESPLSLGTSNAVYVENCTFDDTRGVLDDVIDGRDGARYVLRYSAMTNVHFHCHGYEGGGLRGTHSYEFYENRLTYDEPVSGGSRIGYIRGGTGVIFNNTGIGNWGPLLVVHQCVYRICHGSSCTSYPCQDQIGRTTDHDDNGVQDLVPLFEWGNRRIDYTDPRLEEDIDIIVQDDVYPEMNDYIQEGRDFYNDAVIHDPETGVYTSTYADDDSSTKQWSYKPYVYPHPLTQDLVLTGTAASGAVGLAWEVTTAFPYPQHTTWQIGYASRVGGSTIATSELVSPTRAYTLTGLVPNIPYTVTLSGMVDVPWGDPIPWASATAVVTPTGLTLRGRPGNTEIYLDWEITPAPPSPTTTWQVDYYSQTVTLSETIAASGARTHTLTSLTNYHWYTVTLHAMLGETSWLSDTVRVMPTDRFVYLPLVLR
jgi:hypothetical protein